MKLIPHRQFQLKMLKLLQIFLLKKKKILLQTASVSIYGVDNDKLDNIPLLFDCGSQRSYVSDKLRKRFKLPTLRSEKISINTFGNKESVTKMTDLVQLKFFLKDKVIQIECLCTSLICNDIVNQDIMSASSSYHT